jgi:hypothetical protein
MITKVTVSTKQGSSEFDAVLHGDLAAILNVCGIVKSDKASSEKRLSDNHLPESQLSVVAGARFELTTFRL